MEIFAGAFAALYTAHHIGDYWTQRDCDARSKELPGWPGQRAALTHVITYVFGQFWLLMLLCPLGMRYGWSLFVALLVSGVMHYAADRREYGVMFKLARAMPWKVSFLRFGQGQRTLGTGAWALDQSWHIATSVFLPALILSF